MTALAAVAGLAVYLFAPAPARAAVMALPTGQFARHDHRGLAACGSSGSEAS